MRYSGFFLFGRAGTGLCPVRSGGKDSHMKSYSELKSLISCTTSRPSKALILEQNPELVDEYMDGTVHACVYINGWVTYEDDNRRTNFNLNWYTQLFYDVDLMDGEMVSDHIIPEAEYDACDWIIPITVIGLNRIEKHANRNYADTVTPIDGNQEYENEVILRQIDARETAQKLAQIKEAMQTLTDRQREVIDLYYGDEGVTDSDVARWLGLARTTVNQARLDAEKRIRAYCMRN